MNFRDDSRALFAATGLTGFIGNRFREIVEKSFPIVPLALSEPSAQEVVNKPDGEDAVRPMVLFHLAGPTGQSRAAGEEETIRRAIVDLAERVANELSRHNYSRLVFVSSAALETDSESRLRRSGYALGKAEAELLLTRAAQERDVPLVILRPTRVVGPGDRRRSLLPLMQWIARGRLVPLGKDSWANFVYVDDLAAALLRAGTEHLEVGVHVVNEPIPWKRFLEMIASSLAVSLRSLRVPSPLLRIAARGLAVANASRLRLVAGRLEELAGSAPIRCETLLRSWPDFPEVGLQRGLSVLAGAYRAQGLL